MDNLDISAHSLLIVVDAMEMNQQDLLKTVKGLFPVSEGTIVQEIQI